MLTYSDIQEGDLFTFFNFNEISRTQDDDSIVIMLKPGGFVEHIDISMTLDANENFREGNLVMDRAWVGDSKQLNVFAKDIGKSFINELVHPEDKTAIGDLANLLFKVVGSDDSILSVESIFGIDEISDSVSKMAIRVFAGLETSAVLEFSQCKIIFENLEFGTVSRLEILVQY